MSREIRWWSLGAWSLTLAGVAGAQVTQRVSLDSNGVASGMQCMHSSISADGRFVAFTSFGVLVPEDTNSNFDVYVRDRLSGTTERVSVDSSGAESSEGSHLPAISRDGRSVVFQSMAGFAPGDVDGDWDLYVHDRQTGSTVQVNVDSGGVPSNGSTNDFAISGDGRYVAFESSGTDLVPGDTNGSDDVFVRDLVSGTTERVSLTTSGVQADSASGAPSISEDGRFVAFESHATNLVAGDTNGLQDVFVRDRQLGTTELASLDSSGSQANQSSFDPAISADGRYVGFACAASNLVPGDTNGFQDVFLRDRQAGSTERVSVSSAGAEGNSTCSGMIAISDDGRTVAFTSFASNFGPPGYAGLDIFVRDLQLGTTEQASVSSAGVPADDQTNSEVSVSADGRFVAFSSYATNLVPGDTPITGDVFVRDRFGGTSFTSLCDPGSGGVVGCPCSNPPGGPGRGCENSAATGGAVLSALGGAYLSSDSLVFTTSGEKPTALTILLQGTNGLTVGVAYGQGVRCVGGTLKRLFVKNAVAGSITAPVFGAGDPTVSARSAAKGDVIQAGQSRWVLAVYRDPAVLGGCPASSGFNATQTGRIAWSP